MIAAFALNKLTKYLFVIPNMQRIKQPYAKKNEKKYCNTCYKLKSYYACFITFVTIGETAIRPRLNHSFQFK